MTSTKKKVSVTIADRKFVFHVLPETVEIVEQTANRLNQAISEYSAKFPDRDMQDILSLVLMEVAMAEA